MRTLLATALAGALALVLTLGSVIVLIGATLSTARLTNPLLRIVATVAELIAGIFWLLGTIYVATHLAVVIFGERREDAAVHPSARRQ